MTTRSGGVAALLFGASAAALLAVACASGSGAPQACVGPEQCPAQARCVAGACVANAPPFAVIDAPVGPVEAFAMLVLDGGRSTDADAPDDAVVSFAWSFASVDAPCAPPSVAGTGPTAIVRFGCPGRYEVRLTVRDALDLESAPAVLELEVVPSSVASVVSVGPDVVVPHACAGAPLRCIAGSGAIPLAAELTSTALGPVAFRWSVQPPPDRPLDARRRATFLPSPDVAAPSLVIETFGTAISGDWILSAEARDAAGVVGTAALRVSVGNLPPVVTGFLPVAFEHGYDPAARRFTSSGEIAVAVTDPDGDPIAREATWRAVGDGGATFVGADLGDRLTFEIEVPYEVPSDASYLIGAVGLARSIELAVRDVNGAGAAASWPVVVNNRRPVKVQDGDATVPHAYDPIAREYRASAGTTSWSDPDGDPLFQAGPTGDPVCTTFDVIDGVAVTGCAVGFGQVTDLSTLVGLHTVQQRVRDPWVEAAVTGVSSITVLNTPLRVNAPSLALVRSCTAGQGCCPAADGTCSSTTTVYGPASGTLGFKVSDVDGDPVEVSLTPTSGVTIVPATRVCPANAACPFQLEAPPVEACSPPSLGVAYVASDGILVRRGSLTLSIPCE